MMPSSPIVPSAEDLTLSKVRLLFIDDDHSVLASLHMLFDSTFQTFSAASVSEGLEMVEKAHPNVIILDLKLPDGSGIDLLRRIRRFNANVPVIVLTGYSTRGMAEECVRLGATDYLNKPFEAKALRECVEKWGLSSKVSEDKKEYECFVANSLQSFSDFREFQNASGAFIHDVAGPLSCLMAGSDLLTQSVAENDIIKAKDIRDVVDMMGSSVNYLRALIEQWRSFSDLHSLMHGKFELRHAIDFALNQIMGQVVSNGVLLQIQTPHEEIHVPGNHHAVARVLINLLKNAVEAVDPLNGRIHVAVKKAHGVIVLTVSDNGPGVDFKRAPRIFESGFTTKSQGKGMGLFISRKLVEAMGGKITVDSPGALSGCDFTITFPLAP